NGATGTAANPLYIFNEPTQVAGSAATMKVTMTDPSQIAAASAGNETGDNSNAVAMAALANQTIVNGQTPINSYSNFVSTLGSTVLEVQTENTSQNASVTQLQTQNNALSSVNLNDEAAAMSTLETSYQAASQVFTLLNTIMASALNLGEQTTVS
ncbi:MAG: flagellar hook-associated protein FlgK, partial [Terracidiphilus sp.]